LKVDDIETRSWTDYRQENGKQGSRERETYL